MQYNWWQLLLMLWNSAQAMQNLKVGESVNTDEVGVPPVYVTWQDGRRYTVALNIKRFS